MVEPKILLSPEYGVNPAMAFCPRCRAHNGEILLLGDMAEFKCRACGQMVLDSRRGIACPNCKSRDLINKGKYGGKTTDARIVGNLCEPCREEVAMQKAEVARGGIYFRCKGCKAQGVIKAEGPVGIELEKCPSCAKEEQDEKDV